MHSRIQLFSLKLVNVHTCFSFSLRRSLSWTFKIFYLLCKDSLTKTTIVNIDDWMKFVSEHFFRKSSENDLFNYRALLRVQIKLITDKSDKRIDSLTNFGLITIEERILFFELLKKRRTSQVIFDFFKLRESLNKF